MNIFFLEAGEGIPVVFLHGFCENHELWDHFQKQLASDCKIISIDLPGYGESPLLHKEFKIEDIAIEVKNFMDAQNISECVMIGHSLGGYITLAFAEHFPQQLKGFGLFHSSAYPDTLEKKHTRTKTIEFVRQNGVAPFIHTLIPSLFYEERKSQLQDIIDKQKLIGNETPAETVIAYLAAMRDRKDRTEILQNFDKPIMMIIGKEDQAVPYDKSIEQAKMLKQPYVLELEQTGHMGMFEKEQETLEFVKKFIEACR